MNDRIAELEAELKAEREVGHNTAVALAQQITKLEDQVKTLRDALMEALALLNQSRYDAGDSELLDRENALRAKWKK